MMSSPPRWATSSPTASPTPTFASSTRPCTASPPSAPPSAPIWFVISSPPNTRPPRASSSSTSPHPPSMTRPFPPSPAQSSKIDIACPMAYSQSELVGARHASPSSPAEVAMDKVRFGVVGLGNMGSLHVSYLNQIDGAVLAAVCAADKPRVDNQAKPPDNGNL